MPKYSSKVPRRSKSYKGTVITKEPLYLFNDIWKHINSNQLNKASAKISNLLKTNPLDAKLLALMGLVNDKQKEYELAVSFFQRAITLKPEKSEYYYYLGNVLRRIPDYASAEKALKQAVKLNNKLDDAYFLLGMIAVFSGNKNNAEKYYRRVVELNPSRLGIYYNIANIKKATSKNNLISELNDLIDSGKSNIQQDIYLNFSLAKQYEDIADFDNAYKYYSIANNKKYDSVKYDINKTLRFIYGVMRNYDQQYKNKYNHDAYGVQGPIFIVGMPRSGSTLLEQMLANHEEISTVGESGIASNIIARSDISKKIVSITTADDVNIERYVNLGIKYYENAIKLCDKDKIILDKSLNNFLYIGIIRLMLPGSKFIHIKRDPRDTILSCYKNIFSHGHNYSYDLDTLFTYYSAYRSIMNHWESLFPEYICSINHEDLVADPEKELKKCLRFVNLKWNPACLEYKNNKRKVSTSSALQIRGKLSKSYTGKWKNYEKQMASIFEKLSVY